MLKSRVYASRLRPARPRSSGLRMSPGSAMDSPLIRHETPADIPRLRSLNVAAFPTPAEARLVDALRENEKFTLSLVAEKAGEVVGHILFTDIVMEPGGTRARVVGLAPMAVHPGCQGRGIGSALVKRGVEDCRELGYRAIVVLGYPEFYARFGFGPASRHGITCAFDVPDEYFMLRALGNFPVAVGRAHYQPEFNAL